MILPNSENLTDAPFSPAKPKGEDMWKNVTTHCEEWLKVGIFHLFYHMLGLCQWAFHEQTALTFASKIVFYPNCITLATIL